jgi:CUG-BP- and ETR3-like factor
MESSDSHKVFVGQLPKSSTEEDLMRFFSSYGEIVNLAILRDKKTKAHKGLPFLPRMQS